MRVCVGGGGVSEYRWLARLSGFCLGVTAH